MRRALTGIVIFLSGVVAFSTARPAGVHEDAIGQAGFLYAPQERALRATFTRTNGDERDASVFAVAMNVPLRDRVLFQVEQPFVSVAVPGDIESGFGDLGLRARIRLAGGDRRALHALAGLRTGSGTQRLFPYSSQSLDFDVSLGYVDSLGAVHVWAMGGGGLVSRAPDQLVEAERHDNFARANAGVAVALPSGLRLGAGAEAIAYRFGASRQIYFGEIAIPFSPSIRLVAGGHVEAGDSDERVSDAALTAAVQVAFR